MTTALWRIVRPDDAPEDFSPHNLLVSELWRWRYMNEVLLADLEGDPRTLLAPYGELMQDRLSWAERLYDFAGLEMDDGLDPALIDAAIEQVLAEWRSMSAMSPYLPSAAPRTNCG